MFKRKCIHCGRNKADFCHSCFEELMNQNIDLQVKLHGTPEDIKALIEENKDLKAKLEAKDRYIRAIKRYVDYL